MRKTGGPLNCAVSKPKRASGGPVTTTASRLDSGGARQLPEKAMGHIKTAQNTFKEELDPELTDCQRLTQPQKRHVRG